MRTNSFKSIDLASFGLETLNARTCSSPGFECIEMLIFNALFFQKSLFYKLVSLPILFNAVLLNTKFRTMLNTQTIRDKNINVISKIALSLGISIFAIYKQKPVLGTLASILVLRVFHIFPILSALGLQRNNKGSKLDSRFSRFDQNSCRVINPAVLQEFPRAQNNPLQHRIAQNTSQAFLQREVDARQPSPQNDLEFTASPRDSESLTMRARQPSPENGLGFAAPPGDLESLRTHARQPSPQNGLGFAAPPGDLESLRTHAGQPSPENGFRFAAPPRSRDAQQAQMIERVILQPNQDFTPHRDLMSDQPLQQPHQASFGEHLHLPPHTSRMGFLGFSPRPQVRDVDFQMRRGTNSGRR